MEKSIIERVRAAALERSGVGSEPGKPDNGNADSVPVHADTGQPDTEPAPPAGDVAVDSRTPEEVQAEEFSAWLEDVDSFEIVIGGTSTAAYRRAIAVFDDGDTRVQLAEHYAFRSEDLDRHGRF